MSDVLKRLLEYHTPDVVLLENKMIGAFCRLLQFGVIVYIAVYIFYIGHGYQKVSPVEGIVTAKFQGKFVPNYTAEEYHPDVRHNIDWYRRTWDSDEYSVIYSGTEFLIITNVIITPYQSRGNCPEEHMRWCPIEMEINPLLSKKAVLQDTKNTIVTIQALALFPLFNITLTNILCSTDFRCINQRDISYPKFKLEDMVPGNFDEMAVEGALVVIEITWDCDFDHSPDSCKPTYNFRRLHSGQKYATGHNLRYAKYYSATNRTLYNARGIYFFIATLGSGRKFSALLLLVNIAYGLGLFAVATIVCDILVLHSIPKRRKKYGDIEDVGNQDEEDHDSDGESSCELEDEGTAREDIGEEVEDGEHEGDQNVSESTDSSTREQQLNGVADCQTNDVLQKTRLKYVW